MRKYLMTATLLAGIGATGMAFAGDDCRVPKADWQPREAVQAMAEKQGWTLRRIETDDGCYEIKGTDAQGREIEAKLDPATLAVVKMQYDDGDCRVPMADWQPREAVQAMAEKQGWTVRRIKTDDGCYEIKGRDAQGRQIEVKLDPATLDVVEWEYDDDDDDYRGSGNNAAPTGTVAPPANGLFSPGARPVVEQ
ncbi:PepSY domain-containing protein [Aliiroseovarius sediminis]|uniref:PepSY domain-containing protein n=2 Tax=Aliiroseovarius TaxID=1658781 RepID=UPI00308416AA